MSNIINNLLSNEKTSPSVNNSSTSEQTIKDKPSLFDSLLINESIGKEENKVEEISTIKIDVNEKEEIKDKISETVDIEKVEEVDNKDKVTTKTTSSLLDRLIIEAKKEEKEINKEDSLNSKIDNSSTSVIINESIGKEENKVEEIANIVSDSIFKKDSSLNNIVVNENSKDIVIEENPDKIKDIVKKDGTLSLMDKLIQKNSEKIALSTTENIETQLNLPLKEVSTKDLLSSIYLGSQKNQLINQSLFNKNEAVGILKDGNSVEAIKTSAEILGLGLEDIEIEQISEVEKLDIKKSNVEMVDRKNLIENILSQKNVKSEEIKNLITKSVEASNALIEDNVTFTQDVTVNVNSPISYNIQSRIIGAKQQMATMMSDIAKQMYENYKPPVTAFKINLNPLDLGSIAILMKSDKNNGLSISLSVSNNVTLDALMENQNLLRSSLNKTFDEGTKFNLDFNSSNQNNSNQSSNSQNNQENNRRFEQQMDTHSILQLKEENKEKEEKVLDYM